MTIKIITLIIIAAVCLIMIVQAWLRYLKDTRTESKIDKKKLGKSILVTAILLSVLSAVLAFMKIFDESKPADSQDMYKQILNNVENLSPVQKLLLAITIKKLVPADEFTTTFESQVSAYESLNERLKTELQIEEPYGGLKAQAQESWEKGEFKKAQKKLGEIVEAARIIERRHEEKARQMAGFVAIMHATQGEMSYVQLEYRAAEVFYSQAVEASVEGDERNKAIYLSEMAKMQLRQGIYKKAEQNYDAALSLMENHFGLKHYRIVDVSIQLAKINRINGHYAASANYLRKALKIALEQKTPEKTRMVALINNDLGVVFAAQGFCEKAEEYYSEALQTRMGEGSLVTKDLMESYNNLAALYRKQGREKESEATYKKALQLAKSDRETNIPEFAILHNNIGRLYRGIGKYEDALHHYDRALEIWKKLLRDLLYNHPIYATIINNKGVVWKYQGKNEQAIEAIKEAIAIRRRLLGRYNRLVAESLVTLALVYRELGDYQRAEELYLEALDIAKTLDKANPFYGDVHVAYASFLREVNKPEEAKKYDQEAGLQDTISSECR